MPKEYIDSQDHGREVILFTDGPTDKADRSITSQVMDNNAIKIGWSKESGNVQIAVVDTEKDVDGFEAQHISLDRVGLNRLIRFARRARDDAFGRDE